MIMPAELAEKAEKVRWSSLMGSSWCRGSFSFRADVAAHASFAMWNLARHPWNASMLVKRGGVEAAESVIAFLTEGVLPISAAPDEWSKETLAEDDRARAARRRRRSKKAFERRRSKNDADDSAAPSSNAAAAEKRKASSSSALVFASVRRALAGARALQPFADYLSTTPESLSRYPPEVIALQSGDPSVGADERVDPFPHLEDRNTTGAVHRRYAEMQLRRLRVAMHENRLAPRDLATRGGRPVACLLKMIRGERYGGLSDASRGEAAWTLRELVRRDARDGLREATERLLLGQHRDHSSSSFSSSSSSSSSSSAARDHHRRRRRTDPRAAAIALVAEEVVPAAVAIAIDAREANEVRVAAAHVAWDLVAEEWAGSGSGPGWASRLRRAGAAEAFRGADSDDERWRRARDAVLAALERDEGGGGGGE